MLNTTELIGFGGAPTGLPNISFLDAYEDSAPASDVSFTSISLGEAKNRTLILVLMCDGSPEAVGNCIIDSTYFGTLVGTFGASNTSATSVWMIDIPADGPTTGNLFFNMYGGTPTNAAVGVFVSYDMYLGSPEAHLWATNENPGTLSGDVSLAASIVGGSYGSSGSAITASWSGLTEVYDSRIGTDPAYCSFALQKYINSGSRTLTCTWSSSTNTKHVGAVFTERSASSFWTKVLELGAASDTSAASSTRTFSTLACGLAKPGRLLVASFAYDSSSGSPTVTAVTIGGISATIVDQNISAAAGVGTCIAYAIVPSGTSVDVVCTFSSAVAVGRVKLTEIQNYTNIVPVSFAKDSGAKTALSLIVDMPSGSSAVGVAADNTAGTSTFPLVGASGTSYGNPGTIDVSSFSYQATDAEPSHTIGITTSTANSAAIAAVWR